MGTAIVSNALGIVAVSDLPVLEHWSPYHLGLCPGDEVTVEAANAPEWQDHVPYHGPAAQGVLTPWKCGRTVHDDDRKRFVKPKCWRRSSIGEDSLGKKVVEVCGGHKGILPFIPLMVI